jgi:hypothetical protein
LSKCCELFAVGDCAAVTVPTLVTSGNQQCDIAARQAAMDPGKTGHTAHFLKQEYRNLFFVRHSEVPAWGLDLSEMLHEKIFA